MKRSVLVPLVLLAVLVGCDNSPFDFAPVTGVVTFDGEPLPDAMVVFLPRAKPKEVVAGPDSRAMTDSEGRFRLETRDGREGAVVGSHRVRISTYRDEMISGTEGFKVIAKEKLPPNYNAKTELTCEVPMGGLSEQNFELESRGYKAPRINPAEMK